MSPHPDPAALYLPPGFPLPDREVLDALRRSILATTRTRHAPEAAELAALVAADEADVDLGEIDARAIWAQTVEERRPVFLMIAALLAERMDSA